MKHITYQNETIEIQLSQYAEPNNNAILGFSENGMLYGVFSINVDFPIPHDEVIIDSNNGPQYVQLLIDADIIESEPIYHIGSGFCDFPVYKLKEK